MKRRRGLAGRPAQLLVDLSELVDEDPGGQRRDQLAQDAQLPREREPPVGGERDDHRGLGVGEHAPQLEAAQAGAQRDDGGTGAPGGEQRDHEGGHVGRDHRDALPGALAQACREPVYGRVELTVGELDVGVGEGGALRALRHSRLQ